MKVIRFAAKVAGWAAIATVLSLLLYIAIAPLH